LLFFLTSPRYEEHVVQRILDMRFAAIDFEGAGARPGVSDEPVQVGVALMSGGRLSVEGGLRSYVACAVPVVWRARRVHGISDADLAGAPTMAGLWPRLRDLLAGRWVVAHGAGTERRFLRAYPFHGFGPWVDTLALARALDPSLPSHALGDLAGAYGLVEKLTGMVPGFRWHDAFCDALACLAVLESLIVRHHLRDHPPEVLLNPDASNYHRNRAKNRFR
jgi:DNA polymerase III subunit epsilon